VSAPSGLLAEDEKSSKQSKTARQTISNDKTSSALTKMISIGMDKVSQNPSSTNNQQIPQFNPIDKEG